MLVNQLHKVAGQTVGRESIETVFCRCHLQRVAVTFRTSNGAGAIRKEVVACPLADSGRCDLSCLSAKQGPRAAVAPR